MFQEMIMTTPIPLNKPMNAGRSVGQNQSQDSLIKDSYGSAGLGTVDKIKSTINKYNQSHDGVKIGLSFKGKQFIVTNSCKLSLETMERSLAGNAYQVWRPQVEKQRDADGNIRISLKAIMDIASSIDIKKGGSMSVMSSSPKRSGNLMGYEIREGATVADHPFYGTQTLAEGHKNDFLTNFDPRKVNTKAQTNGAELADQQRPIDTSLPFNTEQITGAIYKTMDNYGMGSDNTAAVNMNSDLGLQYTLKNILRKQVITKMDGSGIEQPSFVLISSGHAIAGLAELSNMTRTNPDGKEQYLFDTSVYMPIGKWSPDYVRTNVSSQGAQIWGDQIEKNKQDQKKMTSAGGVAIALNGHRGDDGFSTQAGTANIDPEKMLGTPEEFKMDLEKRGLKKVVIVTEHYVKDPDKPNILTLEHLRDSDFPTFDEANKDLYGYMKQVAALGVEVIVVSGEQRVQEPSLAALGKQ
jgi:hypothetical protein